MTKKSKTFIKNWIQPTSNFHLIIQSNSPGEVSAWVLPFVQQFKKVKPESTISVCLTPCQYASGEEFDVLTHSPLIDTVWTPKETLTMIKTRPFFSKKNSTGCVLFFGGDPLYSQLIGLKTGFPIYGYTEHKRSLGFLFKKTFFRHEVGDLMSERLHNLTIDKDAIREKYGLPQKPILLVFCGSRPKHFKPFFPFMQETLDHLKQINKNVHPVFLISPFISDETYQPLVQNKEYSIVRGSSIELMSIATCLVSLPGTNNVEATYLRLPMVIVIPLNRPDLIIFDGLLGLLGEIPLIGIWIKRAVIAVLKRTVPFFAPPNRMAQKKIVPEIIEEIEESTLAKQIDFYLQDEQLTSMKASLEVISIPKGVATTIIDSMEA